MSVWWLLRLMATTTVEVFLVSKVMHFGDQPTGWVLGLVLVLFSYFDGKFGWSRP